MHKGTTFKKKIISLQENDQNSNNNEEIIPEVKINNDPFLIDIKQDFVQFDSNNVIEMFKLLISKYSPSDKILPSDIQINVFPSLMTKTKNKITNLADLLAHGNPLFDSIIYLQNKEKIKYTVRSNDEIPNFTFDLNIIGKALFCEYFCIYIRGQSFFGLEHIPIFLSKNFDNLELLQYSLYSSGAICNGVPKNWIKDIPMKDFSTKVLARLQLGAAGHRYLKALIENPPQSERLIQLKLIDSYEAVKNLGSKNLSWDIHPATRSDNILAICVNLNRNLIAFCKEAYTTEELEELMERKIIPRNLQVDKKFNQYKLWKADTFKDIANPIFDAIN